MNIIKQIVLAVCAALITIGFAQKCPELDEEKCVNGTLNPRRSIPRTPTQASLLGIASGLTVRRHRPSKRREAQKPTNSCGSADSLSVRPFQVPTSPLLHLRRARREAKGQNLLIQYSLIQLIRSVHTPDAASLDVRDRFGR